MRETVTIWHWNDALETWRKNIYENATVYKSFGTTGDSAGVKNNCKIKVRIFTTADITISEGDYIYLGRDNDLELNKAKCEKITEFADRRVGKNTHWRISAI